MKEKILKNVSDNLAQVMRNREKKILPKELAIQSGLSYSTLTPILKGSRDFGVTRLIAIANALNTTPNDLLAGTFNNPTVNSDPAPTKKHLPRYLASFITTSGLTHCCVLDVKTQVQQTKMFTFVLRCADNHFTVLEHLKSSISEICGTEVDLKQVYAYISVLSYEHVDGRAKLQAYGDKELGKFIMEPDWMTTHKALFINTSGILITVNNGQAISYSADNGQTLHKITGYDFPISDEAGNYWLGCQAIKHAINAQEGFDARTALSDKVLSMANSNLNLLATRVYDNPRHMYLLASHIVKELSTKEVKSASLIKQSYDNLWKRVKSVDRLLGVELPIRLSGDLAYLYMNFFPKNRLIAPDFNREITVELNYSMGLLSKLISQE